MQTTWRWDIGLIFVDNWCLSTYVVILFRNLQVPDVCSIFLINLMYCTVYTEWRYSVKACTGSSALSYVQLVMRVAEILLLTVITVLLIRARGEKIQLLLRLINTNATFRDEILLFYFIHFPGKQRPSGGSAVSEENCKMKNVYD